MRLGRVKRLKGAQGVESLWSIWGRGLSALGAGSALLEGSWADFSGVISRVTIIITCNPTWEMYTPTDNYPSTSPSREI